MCGNQCACLPARSACACMVVCMCPVLRTNRQSFERTNSSCGTSCTTAHAAASVQFTLNSQFHRELCTALNWDAQLWRVETAQPSAQRFTDLGCTEVCKPICPSVCLDKPNAAYTMCCNACRYKLQPEAANHFPPTGPQTALRSPQADIAAVPPSHNALDTPCNSPQLGDGPAQVTDSSITAAAEAGAVAGIGSSAAAAAVAKVRKVVGASSGTTTSDIAVAAPAAPRFAALLTAANLAAGEMAVGSQTPLPLHLRSDTPTQGRPSASASQLPSKQTLCHPSCSPPPLLLP